MTPKEKKYLIIAVIIIIGIIIYTIWRKKQKGIASATDISNEAAPVILNEEKKVVSTFPLKIGSSGPEVKAIQAWLLKNEGAQIKVDGVWGKQTDAAVKRLLKIDGISQERYIKMGLK